MDRPTCFRCGETYSPVLRPKECNNYPHKERT